MDAKVKVGDRAPDFSLKGQDGRIVSLHDYAGKESVVIYFYPKDFTVGCTAETRGFSENHEAIRAMGAQVLGISSDSLQSHVDFAKDCGASFPLLSDEGGKVRELYGIRSSFGLVPGRVTFVIDKEGVVRHQFSSQIRPTQHVREALEALKLIRP